MASCSTKSNAIDMPGALLIGYGNPLRGDDGLGWEVADQIARNAGDSIKVVTTHQLTPELAEPISKADVVVFVDACHDGQPGRWRCERIRADTVIPQAFAHYLTPMSLLNYAAAIFDAKPAALLISVAADSFEYGETLTPKVAAVVPEIVDYICNHCDARW
jgi:hydrogenase maturation protease